MTSYAKSIVNKQYFAMPSSAIALTASTKHWFFFAAKSENKKLPGVFPHSYSESFVPARDTDEGGKQITLLRRVWLERVDPKSLPTFIASCSRFLRT